MSRPRFRANPFALPRSATSPGLMSDSRRIRAAEIAARSTRMPSAKAYRSAALSHTSTGSYQTITWDVELFDNDDIFAASSTNFTIQTAGIYLVTGVCDFAASATGARYIQIQVNGTAVKTVQTESTASGSLHAGRQVTSLESLAVGDVVTLAAFQNSGGNLAYTIGRQYMSLEIVMVSS